jgi:hypothetical protein
VASTESTRSVGEIRDYLIKRLNLALLLPGMFGGELTTMMHLGDLAWIDRRDAALRSVVETLEEAGAWSSTAVRGAFQLIFGGTPADHDSPAALVYAGIARPGGTWSRHRPVLGVPGPAARTPRRGVRAAAPERPGVDGQRRPDRRRRRRRIRHAVAVAPEIQPGVPGERRLCLATGRISCPSSAGPAGRAPLSRIKTRQPPGQCRASSPM